MAEREHFCTCTDTACKLNPCNHDLGCDPCIKKNLREGEIPSCFFHLVREDISELSEFTLESFTDFYLKNKRITS
ncbi:hypothetical protein Ami103574_08455 [Aminipila butyrica]|uniref:Uncharacterized protein n=1 Tax=Aminipila butyrica TaxID=433296 RepID=A0A858BTU4_9FIRM|nr:DUF6485 family protein [Aminipila butyrica]QIB69353.1 hypothetical protein Ami103574_08455 [Aminipila butyrica]